MAFRTNKVPAIEERTVSGSSVSFNSAFALPLKACKVSFSATQAGSGDPSPSNPRAISGVSAIGLNANSTPVSVSLGDTRYGGELDVLTGELIITHVYADSRNYDNTQWGEYTYQGGVGVWSKRDFLPTAANRAPYISNMARQGATSSAGNKIWCGVGGGRLIYWLSILDDLNISIDDFKSWIVSNPLEIVYELAEPITIQLSPTQLSSIIGNNTFSTDTGTLEITFADLQEKSASGAVATFNTALAMPLVECKTEFMCTQEAGTPSPSNPLPITGVDDITLTVNGNSVVIDLDGTRYGGYVNVLSGVLTINAVKAVLRGSMFNTWVSSIKCIMAIVSSFADAWLAQEGGSGLLFSHGRVVSRNEVGSYNNCVVIGDTTGGNQGVMFLKLNSEITDLASGQAYIEAQYEVDTPLEVAYLLATPIEISLSDIPTLSTIIGNNSFASDSGNIDLTYKDLDIAKRGSFREVFKLPS